jgi:predicted amidophosphoribosyltransferase
VQIININYLTKWKEIILNILYPPTCPICGEILKVNNNQVCSKCKKKIRYIHEPVCKKMW